MDEAGEGTEGSGKPSALDEYCVNLNQKASEGRIDPLIGRDEEVEKNDPGFVSSYQEQPARSLVILVWVKRPLLVVWGMYRRRRPRGAERRSHL